MSKTEDLFIGEKMIKYNQIKLDKELISKFVHYDETSPSCLRWNSGTRKAGKPAGNVSTVKSKTRCYSRYRVQIGDTKYIVSRLILLLHGEDLDNLFVDHKDGNSLNNKISNLRAVSQDINARNAVKTAKNKSGIVGVKIINNKEGIARSVQAYWSAEGDMNYKSFSVKKYGLDLAIYLAKEYRFLRLKELNEKGAGYTHRHITQRK
jgi:HNH endonuclease